MWVKIIFPFFTPKLYMILSYQTQGRSDSKMLCILSTVYFIIYFLLVLFLFVPPILLKTASISLSLVFQKKFNTRVFYLILMNGDKTDDSLTKSFFIKKQYCVWAICTHHEQLVYHDVIVTYVYNFFNVYVDCEHMRLWVNVRVTQVTNRIIHHYEYVVVKLHRGDKIHSLGRGFHRVRCVFNKRGKYVVINIIVRYLYYSFHFHILFLILLTKQSYVK